MATKTDKKFVGNVKTAQTSFGEIIKLGFKVEDLEMLMKEVKGGWVNIDLKSSQKGGYYMEVNDFVPTKGAGKSAQPAMTKDDRAAAVAQAQVEDDLPF